MEKKLALLVCSWLVVFSGFGEASESDNIWSYKFSRFLGDFGAGRAYSSEHIATEDESMQADKITALPGQPEGVDFDQYAGYVTVNGGKALFYYFVESPQNSSTNPLVLWLNGGPGCSSVGFGAMAELGPFRVNNDGETLFRNNYAWNNVANVIFLESPAGVGFSYSNTSSDYNNTGDKSTADDAYTFLVNWLERFPQYKTRDFYIVGESYGGHYAPQLAYSILLNNENTTQTIINLKGVAIGNGWIDDHTNYRGMYDSLWTHGFISDETYEAIVKNCGDFSYGIAPPQCNSTISKALTDRGNVDNFNIYAPLCHDPPQKQNSNGSMNAYDPCFKSYLLSYFNQEDVQKALHANPTNWSICRSAYLHTWNDRPTTILPIIKTLMASGLRLWMYSGDLDPIVPVTSARYTINSLKLQVKNAWSPWYSGKEVGGNVVAYEGLTFITIRAAGHLVPTYQPERSLIMVSSFLRGTLPPSS